jgi:lactoylglutathione lyase
MHFLHLTLKVRDFSKSLRFYESFVGLQNQRQFTMGEWEIVFLADQDGATQIELVYMPEGVKIKTEGMTVCFQTEDLDGVYQKALEWDLNPSDIRNPDPQSRYFYVYDPDGVSIEFKQKMSIS